MGSKVSSKMAAPAARVIQAVRPHTPLIKFPNRQDMLRPNAQEALKTLAVNFSPHASGSHPASVPPPLSRPHVPLTPIPGTADTLASIQLLPARYRRRPLTVDEMDFIQRGGPEWHGGTRSPQPKSLSAGDQYVSLILFLSTGEPDATWCRINYYRNPVKMYICLFFLDVKSLLYVKFILRDIHCVTHSKAITIASRFFTVLALQLFIWFYHIICLSYTGNTTIFKFKHKALLHRGK